MAERKKVLYTKSDDLVLEKFFNDYIVPWYQERVVNAHTYSKASKEILLLQRKSGKKQKVSSESTDEEKRSVQHLPDKPSNANSRRPNVRPTSASQTPKPKANIKGQNEARKQTVTKTEVDSQHVLFENAKYKKRLSEMEEEICEIKAQADIDLRQKNQQLEKLRMALENSKAQVDELTIRLSKLAGDKLRAGNPDLADLSDSYRPTELGKMFSEIYDNEWSDAFENVLETEVEERRVGLLHGVVKKAFTFCEEKFFHQVTDVRAILLAEQDQSAEKKSDSPALKKEMKTTRTANIHNLLKDIRKQMAPQTAENIAKEFVEVGLGKFVLPFVLKHENITKPLKKYAFKCAELCWFMMVCDPQMTISEDKMEIPFDLNMYKPYTKSTKDLKKPVVKLPVWPALHLHDGGPLVAKGVAQPGEGDLKN